MDDVLCEKVLVELLKHVDARAEEDCKTRQAILDNTDTLTKTFVAQIAGVAKERDRALALATSIGETLKRLQEDYRQLQISYIKLAEKMAGFAEDGKLRNSTTFNVSK